MIPTRYHAPGARRLFSDEIQFQLWTDITRAYALADIEATHGPEADRACDDAFREPDLKVPTPEAVAVREATLGHDVVAFLSLIEDQLPDLAKRHLHYGLTSSDLVDNALFMQIREHAQFMAAKVNLLCGVLKQRWEFQDSVRAGRTHGQVADLTTWGHQMNVYRTLMDQIAEEFNAYRFLPVFKSPGPTGHSSLIGDRGARVAILAFNGLEVPSTQVIPRDHLVRWAALYVRLAGVLENLAVLVRAGARADMAEVQENAVRVGSSAMPHKSNPIGSEKVCGLASVARGYFVSIAEGSVLWEDRDLSNSSLERIAVPDLAAVVEHMVHTMVEVMNNLDIDLARMRHNAEDERTASHILQAFMQSGLGLGPVQAGSLIRKYATWDPPDYRLNLDTRGIAKALDVDHGAVVAVSRLARQHWSSLVG